VDVVEALAGAFQEGWLSTRFAYRLAAALTELGVYGVAGAEGVSLDKNNLRDTVRSLLRLHFRRALDPKLDDAQKGFMQDKVLGPLEGLLEVASSAHDFMDLIMAVAFRVRPEETGA
jgi:hypothetical protein